MHGAVISLVGAGSFCLVPGEWEVIHLRNLVHSKPMEPMDLGIGLGGDTATKINRDEERLSLGMLHTSRVSQAASFFPSS